MSHQDHCLSLEKGINLSNRKDIIILILYFIFAFSRKVLRALKPAPLFLKQIDKKGRVVFLSSSVNPAVAQLCWAILYQIYPKLSQGKTLAHEKLHLPYFLLFSKCGGGWDFSARYEL